MVPSRSRTLTARESQVLDLLASAATNRDIATELNITVETVKRHLSTIFDKMGLDTRLEVVVKHLNDIHTAELSRYQNRVAA